MNIDFKSLPQAILAHVRYGDRARPLRDWFVMLSIAALLLAASAAWNAWLFYQVGQGEVIGSAATSSPLLDTASGASVETVFAKRAAEALRFKDEYRFVDPRQ